MLLEDSAGSFPIMSLIVSMQTAFTPSRDTKTLIFELAALKETTSIQR